MSVQGGQATVICDAPDSFSTGGGCSWSEDGNIYFTTGNSGIYRVSQIGGDPTLILEPTPDVELDFHEGSALPGGRGILAVLHREPGYDTILAVTGNGDRKEILRLEETSISTPTYSPGYIVFSRQGQTSGIWAVPFSLSSLETTGDPILIASGCRFPATSLDGTLIYFQGTLGSEAQLHWVNRPGQLGEPIGLPQINPLFPELSPDEQLVSLSIGVFENHGVDLWVQDVVRGTGSRLSNPDSNDILPSWPADGRSIFFTEIKQGSPSGIYRRNADGTGEPEPVVEDALGHTLTLDGRYLIFHRREPGENETGIGYKDLTAQDDPRSIFTIPGEGGYALVSPSGRFLAYSSQESGKEQVYVKRFPSGEGRWPVSVDSGLFQRWSRDETELFFVNDENQLFAVSIGEGPSFGKPELLFDADLLGLDLQQGYDVSNDGQRFVAIRSAEGNTNALTVIQNWQSEFQEPED